MSYKSIYFMKYYNYMYITCTRAIDCYRDCSYDVCMSLIGLRRYGLYKRILTNKEILYVINPCMFLLIDYELVRKAS